MNVASLLPLAKRRAPKVRFANGEGRTSTGKTVIPARGRAAPGPIDPPCGREKVSPSPGGTYAEPREFPLPSPPRTNAVYSLAVGRPTDPVRDEGLIPDEFTRDATDTRWLENDSVNSSLTDCFPSSERNANGSESERRSEIQVCVVRILN